MTMTHPKQKLAYNLKEAAAAVGLSITDIRQRVSAGDIAVRYVGSEPLVLFSELESWLLSLPSQPKIGAMVKPQIGERDVSSKPSVSTASPPSAPAISIVDADGSNSIAPELLTPEDLARTWQVSPGTIANWRTAGKGPKFVRVGGLVRYHRDAVKAWIDVQATT